VNFHNYLHGVLSSGSTSTRYFYSKGTINYTYSESADSTHHITNLHWLHLVSFFSQRKPALSFIHLCSYLFPVYIQLLWSPKTNCKILQKGQSSATVSWDQQQNPPKIQQPLEAICMQCYIHDFGPSSGMVDGCWSPPKGHGTIAPITVRFRADDHASFWICWIIRSFSSSSSSSPLLVGRLWSSFNSSRRFCSKASIIQRGLFGLATNTLKTWKAHILIFLLESCKRCKLVETEMHDKFEAREKCSGTYVPTYFSVITLQIGCRVLCMTRN